MSYKIDRTKFIDWIWDNSIQYQVISLDIKKDLQMGGEFVLTATEILASTINIPTALLENYNGNEYIVRGSDCELIYKQPFV